ncbi:MAG: hypothetical protein DRR08_10710 [Candidatus Parabeggiatoa sp. nov. 2]|nr:MAG: hypothetical protein DRR08_10710 [Gammaproteobacteria bacterium]
MVQNGTATLPELIGDRAIAFGLAATLGMLQANVTLPKKDYRNHLKAMPYRTSVFTTDAPKLLPPLIRRLNLDEDGGYPQYIQKVVKSGNLATYFQTQEVPHGQRFKGAIFGFDPFTEMDQKELVIRIGLHRNGMLLLKPDNTINHVCLNAATAALFKQELPVKRYCLHSLQITPEYTLANAWQKVNQWH